MECEDWIIEEHLFEETEEADGGEEEEEEEEDDDGDGGDEAEDDEELEEEVGEEFSARFKEMINLLDLFKDNSHVKLYQQFERIENEALAEKKRKALAAGQGKGPVKRPRQESTAGATSEELAEVYEYGNGRRRSRKPKKRGRRKGSRNKLSPEITKKLGDANLHYAHGRYEDAISLLTEVIRLAPNLPDPYHTLGLVYNSVGYKKKSVDCYMIAAFVGPKDSSLWKPLVTWSIELEDKGQAWYCLKKAIAVDPADITLWYRRASYFMEMRDYSKAAESYDRIVQICPDNVEALKTAATVSS